MCCLAVCLLQYTFTATPVSGGPAVTVTASSPSALMTGLTPGAKVRPLCLNGPGGWPPQCATTDFHVCLLCNREVLLLCYRRDELCIVG